MLSLPLYRKFRARGYRATEAARMAKGAAAIDSDAVTVEFAPDACSCGYPTVGPCHRCLDDRRAKHEGARLRSHRCACPHTFEIVVKSRADRDLQNSLGSVCVNSESDPYLDEVAAELAFDLLAQLPTEAQRKQKEIVHTICDGLADKLCAQIDAGAMPSDFDGFEIRWLLEDMMQREANTDRRHAPRKRRFRAEVRKVNARRIILG